MFRDSLKVNFAQIGLALREPENFTLRWHRNSIHQPVVCLALALTAVAGTVSYGFTMGIGDGPTAIVRKAMLLTIAAGFAWGIPLPALYVLNSLTGSRLKASTTLLAVLVTTSWGGLALIASVPINWFFSVAIPAQVPELFSQTDADRIVLAVNLLVFTGVGVSMADVFRRVMHALEPERGDEPTWVLVLVAVVGCDLFYLFGLFAT
jgi:hypothetical protein